MPRYEVDPKRFPVLKRLGYRRRKASLNVCSSVTLSDLNWSGGTKSIYYTSKISTGETKSFEHFGVPAPWDNPREGATVVIPEGFAVIRLGWFCGKEALATIYMNSIDARVLGYAT